jgi:acyl carrier protein
MSRITEAIAHIPTQRPKAIKLGKTLVEFVASIGEFTHRTAVRFIKAPLMSACRSLASWKWSFRKAISSCARSLMASCRHSALLAVSAGGWSPAAKYMRRNYGARQCWRPAVAAQGDGGRCGGGRCYADLCMGDPTMNYSRQDRIALLVNELRAMDVRLPDRMAEHLTLRSGLSIDSLAVAGFVARMEQLFRVQITDDAWRTLDSVGRVADYPERLTCSW